MTPNMKILGLVVAVLCTVQLCPAAAQRNGMGLRNRTAPTNESEPTNGTGPTNGIDLKQLAGQCLPGCKFLPATATKPRELISATGETLDLLAAARENPEPRKGAGYWQTPTMAFLGKQHIEVATNNDAAGVIQLLHVIWRGADFVKQKTYNALPFDGGWVVEVINHGATNRPGNATALPPYELLVDAGQHVVQIRERCYPYLGSARVYDNTVRSVYEREMKLNGGRNYLAVLEMELAKAWEMEKAQKAVKPAPAPKKE
jgi:hypothetical protein